MRVDPGRRGHRHPHEPLPRHRRERRGRGPEDLLLANDQVGEGANAFQVQHPDDHLYASSTGSPLDCPQPDLGLLPGERTDWTPDPVDTGAEPVLTVSAPADGAVTQDGTITVTGTVEQVEPPDPENDVTTSTAHVDDADDDATTPVTEILDVDATVTDTTVEATISLADLWPTTDLTSPTSYSLVVDGRRFDSFVRYPTLDPNPMTWDNGAAAYMPEGTSTWDLDAKTVSFHLDRAYLEGAGIDAPYFVAGQANLGLLSTIVADDRAPGRRRDRGDHRGPRRVAR